MNDTSESLACRLKRLRQAVGLTQGELARRAGIGPPALCKLESGYVEPSGRTLVALAQALGTTAEELLKGKP